MVKLGAPSASPIRQRMVQPCEPSVSTAADSTCWQSTTFIAWFLGFNTFAELNFSGIYSIAL
jgi:hypothetical protein